MGGMQFEYVYSQDINRGIPGKNTMTRYERRREIIELRKLIIALSKRFPTVLTIEDTKRISKLATCENKHYLIGLFKLFVTSLDKKELGEYLVDGIEFSNATNTRLDDELRAIIRDL